MAPTTRTTNLGQIVEYIPGTYGGSNSILGCYLPGELAVPTSVNCHICWSHMFALLCHMLPIWSFSIFATRLMEQEKKPKHASPPGLGSPYAHYLLLSFALPVHVLTITDRLYLAAYI